MRRTSRASRFDRGSPLSGMFEGFFEAWDDDPDFVDPLDEADPISLASGPARKPFPPRQASHGSWKRQLSHLLQVMATEEAESPSRAHEQELLYIVDVPATLVGQGLAVDLACRRRKANGDWGVVKPLRIPWNPAASLPEPLDRQILALLAGARAGYGYYPGGYHGSTPSRYYLAGPVQESLVPLIARTGRCRLRLSRAEQALSPIEWDDDAPWEFRLDVRPAPGRYLIEGTLCRDGDRADVSAPVLLLASGFVFWRDRAARLWDSGGFAWIAHLRQHGPISVPRSQGDELLGALARSPRLPPLTLPEEISWEEVTVPPRPRLKVKPGKGAGALRGELSFEYDGAVIASGTQGRGIFQARERRLLRRDPMAERAAADRLRELGFRTRAPSPYEGYQTRGAVLELAARHLPRVVRDLLKEGWHVEAEGKVFRHAGAFRIEVSTGIDWFELHGEVEFGDTVATLPEILAALRRGERTVRLDDGTYGMLPEAWLQKYGLLAGLGTAREDHLRFTRSQVGLLDALLVSQPEASWDEAFERAREELRRFDGVKPADPPAGFNGELRGYQRDGLGWLQFLEQFGFGGCLADDMGLGKTVQVLAFLELRRDRARGPSLVVVPKSLVFNWKQEAARFTPGLRVLDYTGADRARVRDRFAEADLVLTTYGTLRRDVTGLADVPFNCVVLDEAQAIKNARTDAARAARLLRARQRLALSGTPVENHLGELWSLFEFLNPGMLGAASLFRLDGNGARNPDEETRRLLACGLRPFILRRTKEQVAADLPPKLEQTLYCELDRAQRGVYDELREHYRRSLLGRIERDGFNRAKILILEALLRLRQAACHPGLIDRRRAGEPSAKLDVLLPRLAEVLDEGHKALVFSQFTSFLAIVRSRLDREGIPYEYLDGRTRDRAARVARFQSAPDCRLFLVSLKAGGLGLNLTAAEYVFLLDPWWNPAVEAQAIDRTHRIGQTRPVFAYRLIARETVEEKILELQRTKRGLADAIITADNSLIRALSREDLELLLS
ncbi:MAG: DEAD/DEAH box helicase [Candidatus Methylomirabilia bacterium]